MRADSCEAMKKRILWSVLAVSTAVLLASFVAISVSLFNYFGNVREKQLIDELSLAAVATERMGVEYLEQVSDGEYRLTLVASDGTVLYDSEADAATMDNHLDREEICEALQTGKGNGSRKSSTLTEMNYYEAVLLSDGTVLRIAVSGASMAVLMMGMLRWILVILVVSVIFAVLMAKRMAKKVTDPLNRLDLEHPLENDAYEELAPLLRRIHDQHKEIEDRLHDLRQSREEFAQVTSSMREGLVLLNRNHRVLSINPAAQTVFETDDSCVGEDFLKVDRRHDVNLAIESAVENGHAEVRAEKNGREYQFDVSRISSDGAALGVVLLAFDVTEQANAERNRREFTANVSHELKTPLQSIIGSADLMENGLVQPEDMPRFVGHIRTEAARLLALVNDIIRLSQLDEGVQMQTEEVSLLALSQEAVSSLAQEAEQKHVSISASGDDGRVTGVRRLLYEIVYNLCENAIKYNVENGSVEVHVAQTSETVVLTVRDTGIGIAPEHQSRVFERFYRVDKSHSKKSGGTGLGLSIVKHAAMYHNAEIDMKSAVGKGTTVTVTFRR